MGIRNGGVKILSCNYSTDKPAGASMEVNITYSDETWMAERSAKDMKAKIFQHSDDKNICKKYELKKKTYCMDLQQWCVMAGPAPRGARFTVSSLKDGKCVVSQNPSRTKPVQP